MSFYKKIKEDAKRQRKEIMKEGEGYYSATVFEHYGAPQKRQFSWARVLTNTAFLVVILIAGIWGIFGITDNSHPLSTDSLGEYASQERYEEESLIYNSDGLCAEAAYEVNDYKEGGWFSVEKGDSMRLEQQNGVVLADLSFFSGQSATVSYKVFENEKGEEMYYLFTVDAQEGKLEIITFIKERYSPSQYKKDSQKLNLAGKTVYLKSIEINGETQYYVFFKSGQKGVFLLLATPADTDTAETLLENILSNLTE